jgi:hypothetical protein
MADTLNESFSRNAADMIRLRRALYGPDDAKALMMRCFKRSPKAVKINETTVLNCWEEQDDAADAALGFDGPAERAAKREAYMQAHHKETSQRKP